MKLKLYLRERESSTRQEIQKLILKTCRSKCGLHGNINILDQWHTRKPNIVFRLILGKAMKCGVHYSNALKLQGPGKRKVIGQSVKTCSGCGAWAVWTLLY